MRFAALLKSSLFSTLLSAAALALVSTPSAAHADTLSFFNTGVANDGTLLSAGSADAHYSLIYSSDGGTYTATATSPNGAWTTAPDAGWISPSSSGYQDASSGYFGYEANLDLTGYDPTTAVLSGLLATDNAVYIYLNRGGSPVFSSVGFSAMTPFLINSGFVSGMNEIDFLVVNYSGPTGLLVSDTQASASAVTPEPDSIYLLGTGMAGMLGMLVRKYRA